MSDNDLDMIAWMFGENEPLNDAKLKSFYAAYVDDLENNEGQRIATMLLNGFPPILLDTLVDVAQRVAEAQS